MAHVTRGPTHKYELIVAINCMAMNTLTHLPPVLPSKLLKEIKGLYRNE